MSITYNPLLVLLSVVVAIQASYVGLRLTIQVPLARGLSRKILLTSASLSLGLGIWGMHFVGMLAMQLPIGVDYRILPTLLSFLLCVLVVGFAILGTSLWPKTPAMLGLAAGVMGCGITTMHYVGMAALRDCIAMHHDWVFGVASIVAAVAAAGAALWLATMARRRPPLILCAVLLGLATAGMHYGAMAGTHFVPLAEYSARIDAAPRLSTDLMGIVVAIVAFVISAIFLLTLVPDVERPRLDADGAADPNGGIEPPPAAMIGVPDPAMPAATAHGGAGLAAVTLLATPAPQALPVERDGRKIMIAPRDVYAVKANAHYSQVFTGEEDLFCPLSIGEVEACLGKAGFIRVHRSHIVNVERIAGVRKTADGGFVDIAAHRALAVPVSRAKIGLLRDRFGASAGATTPSAPRLRATSA